MGVLPTPNHLALIRDCYPPHTNSSESELPRPVSNAVSKLAFYAVNRPAKLPKVVAALTDRAARATGGAPVPTSSSSSTAHAHPVKNRVQLAVTCEIFRTLVIECAESGNQGSAELVKSALAEPALSVADMALGGGSAGPPKSARDANTRTASPTLRRPDAELEARGASLVSSLHLYITLLRYYEMAYDYVPTVSRCRDHDNTSVLRIRSRRASISTVFGDLVCSSAVDRRNRPHRVCLAIRVQSRRTLTAKINHTARGMLHSRLSKAPHDQTSCLRPGAILIDKSVKSRPLSSVLASLARHSNSKKGEPSSGTDSVFLSREKRAALEVGPVTDFPAVSTGCSSRTRFRPSLLPYDPAKRLPSPRHPPRPTRLPLRKRRRPSLQSQFTVSPISRVTRQSRNSSSFTRTFSRTSRSTRLLR